VTPPPDDFVRTVAHVDAPATPAGEMKAYGKTWWTSHFDAFKITVPPDYKAVSGYIQRTNPSTRTNLPDEQRMFEFYVGENTFVRFRVGGPEGYLNSSFTMSGETGEVPVTMCSFTSVLQFNFAVAINCQRTDKALEQWQLKTHAAISQGYQRQLAEYEDKLARFTTAMRAQMAAAANYGHNPSIEEEELKKAFLYLLIGEHATASLLTPTPAPMPPYANPPDPKKVKDWGARVAFFERAFEWDNLMYTYYPYFWGRPSVWEERILIQDVDPQFEAFLKAGAARIVVPVRPGFEGALAHYHETGDVWMGEEIPDMFSDLYVSIIAEIKARNLEQGKEVCVAEWDVKLPTTLIMLKDDATLPEWKPSTNFVLPPPSP
jgi:hypothetical protein